jgi:predicted metal-binding membrane protein
MSGNGPAASSARAATAEPTFLEAVLAHDRIVVICGLIAVVAAAWIWIAIGAGMDTAMMDTPGQQMPGMTGMTMSVMTPASWSPGYAAFMFSMWWIMMIAMMLPSATPTLLLFARINRKEKTGGRPYVPTAIFTAGYLAVWGGFSVIATSLQWAFERASLLSSSMMASTSIWLVGAILIAAGLWQLTPVKTVCLRHCRSPLSFLSGHWKPGHLGAFRMGLEHGAYCVGCCWFLMGLLFVGGIMNLYWVAGLAAFVLIEKTIPLGHWVSRGAGAALLIWGAALLFANA